MRFATLMASLPGRLARIVAGLALVAVGLGVLQGTAGWVVAVVGLVPIAAGAFNFCGIAPLLGAPFRACNLAARQAPSP